MKLLFDLHTHTLMSGHAYSTLSENIAIAKERGLLAYGFSEHAPALEGTVTDIYFQNFKVIPKEINGLKIFGGVEANIMDYDGNTDCNEAVLSKVHYAIASLHSHCIEPGTIEENTRALVGAMQNPYIKIIGHPDDARFPSDFDTVVKEAVKTGTIIELNNGSLNPLSTRQNGRENMRKLIAKCMEYGAKVIVSSDSHICYEVGDFTDMLEILEEMKMPEELVINTSLDGLDYVISENARSIL